MPYTKKQLSLSKGQLKNLAKAIKTTTPIKIKFSYNQLKSNNNLVPLMLTQRQINRINKAITEKKGIVLSFSKKQINAIKQDGGIAPIIPAIGLALLTGALSGGVSAVSKYGVDKIIDKFDPNRGKGMKPIGQGLRPIGYGNDLNFQRKFAMTGPIKMKPPIKKKKVARKKAGTGLFPLGVRQRRV